MRVTITIDCDNAAFADCASNEVARILTELARDVNGLDFTDKHDRRMDPIRDFNGNTVGHMQVSE